MWRNNDVQLAPMTPVPLIAMRRMGLVVDMLSSRDQIFSFRQRPPRRTRGGLGSLIQRPRLPAFLRSGWCHWCAIQRFLPR